MNIVYCDHDVTVIEKPAGYLSEADGKNPDVLTAAKQLTGSDCLLVHRLDKETGGLMVLANHRQAAAALSKAVTEKLLEKEYLAVVSGCPQPAEGAMTDLLFRDARKNRSFVVTRLRKGVKEARLTYRTLDTAQWTNGETVSLVRVKLETGRTHQIRVQFASRKMPLAGDSRYGSRLRDCSSALFSCRLCFPHPGTGEILDFSSLPERMSLPWNLFSDTAYQ